MKPKRYIIMFTRDHHWSLSWTRCIQSIPSHPISLRSILISSFHLHLGLLSVRFSSCGRDEKCIHHFVCISHLSHACYILHPSNGMTTMNCINYMFTQAAFTNRKTSWICINTLYMYRPLKGSYEGSWNYISRHILEIFNFSAMMLSELESTSDIMTTNEPMQPGMWNFVTVGWPSNKLSMSGLCNVSLSYILSILAMPPTLGVLCLTNCV